MNKKSFYITTPIYYPSAKFHIGTCYSTIIADTLARYKSEKGFDTYFLTGVDEHGQKIQEVALGRGLTPQEHVDEMAADATHLWKFLDIRYNDFIRTTEKRHSKVVVEVFERLLAQDDIYLGEYEGWYCIPDETFFTETQLVDNKCPDCGRDVVKMKEESYFFNMKKYEKRLIEFYEANPEFLIPLSRKNEILNNFIKPGLEDLCVSRTSFDWGIKIKSNPKHVIYVWLDALVNYISALGFLSDDDTLLKKFWPADIHIVGKDIIRFHAIYWPIFLMALDLPIPHRLYAHGWVVMKDGKMGKSKGNSIYPIPLVEKYGLDAFKYYLLSSMPFDNDCVFTPEDFVEIYNSDLCNDLGNLLNRSVAMVNKYFGGTIKNYPLEIDAQDKTLEEYVLNQIKLSESLLEECRMSNALSELWQIVRRSNKYIDECEPWNLFKEGNTEKLESVMYHLVENIRKIAIFIRPFMEGTSKEILSQLGINDSSLTKWDSIYESDLLKNIKVAKEGKPIFLRLDKDEQIEYIKGMMQ